MPNATRTLLRTFWNLRPPTWRHDRAPHQCHARALDEHGRPIASLYAAGNDMASIMGGNYPGAGITLGPALTFGYIAGKHIAGEAAH